MSIRNLIGLFAFAAFTCVSCAKESSDVFIPYIGNPANDTSWKVDVTPEAVSNTLFNGLVIAPFIDSFDVTGSALLHVNADLDVAVPAACLTYTNGSAVSPGKVRTEIRHLIRRGDFIRYARPTTTYGKLMESASAFQVKFFRQDQELILKQGKKLFFTLISPNPANDMEVYFGNTTLSLPLPIGTNPFFTWMSSVDSSFVTPFVRQDSNGIKKGYQIFAGKTNWVNCQNEVSTSIAKTRINITMPANFTNTNTAVFAVVKQRNIVVQLNADYTSRSFYAPNIPMGDTIVLVSLSLIGNQYYIGMKELAATQDLITTVNPVSSSIPTINQALSGL